MYDHRTTTTGLIDCCCMTGEFSSQWKSVKFMQDHNPAKEQISIQSCSGLALVLHWSCMHGFRLKCDFQMSTTE